MPTYEYECTKCAHVFERFQSMRDAPVKRCPLCRCKVRKMIGAGAGIIFKGSGFYETDYRSEHYHKAAASEKQSADAAPKADADNKKKTDTTKNEKPKPSKAGAA